MSGFRFLKYCVVAIVFLQVFRYGENMTLAKTPESASLRMNVSATRIYEGDSLRLQVHLDKMDSFQEPDMSYLKNEFDIVFLGEQNRNSSMISIINGRQQRFEERGITYNYKLVPKRSGSIVIQSPEVAYRDEILKASAIEVEVVPPSDQDLVLLELSLSRSGVYPCVPFDVTLSVLVKELPGKYQKLDPVKVLAQNVGNSMLSIPWLEDERLPAGLVPDVNWKEWLLKYRSDDGGFGVNNVHFDNPFDFSWSFFDQRSPEAGFLPEGSPVEREDANGKTIRYRKYDFVRTFMAEQPGTVNFDTVSLKGIFAREKGNDFIAEEVYTLSNPLTLTVKNVPEENRPENYIGAFGEFDWNVEINPKKIQVGEPITLTATLQGNGSVLNVKAPDIASNKEITDNFKVYPPTEETADGIACFTYSLRPRHEGDIVFPSVPISYFDVRTEKFVSLESAPIPLTIGGGSTLDLGFIPKNHSVNEKTYSSKGLFSNLTDISGVRNRSLSVKRWIAVNAAIFGAGFLSLGYFWILRLEKTGMKKKERLLVKCSRNRLIAALKSREVTSSVLAEIRGAFLMVLQKILPRSVTTLTDAEIQEFLENIAKHFPQNPTPAEKVAGLLKQLEELRYDPSQGTLPMSKKEIVLLFDEWVLFITNRLSRKEFALNRKRGGLNKTMMLLPILGVTLTIAAGCADRVPEKNRQSFELALQLFDEADQMSEDDTGKGNDTAGLTNNTEDGTVTEKNDESNDATNDGETPSLPLKKELFRKVAAIYQGLIDQGIESGAIFYNQGNAWHKSGDDPKALAAWRQAEKYIPANRELKANLATLAIPEERPSSFWRTLFFWQDMISQPAKFRLATTLAFLAFLTFLWTLFLIGGRKDSTASEPFDRPEPESGKPEHLLLVKLAKQLTLIFLIAWFVMSASAFYDWYRFDGQKHGILAADQVIVRKGNSTQYEPLYIEPLPKLTETIVLKENNRWVQVQFSDGQIGWVPENEILIY